MTFRMLSLLGLRKFSEFFKKIVARNFFQGISRIKLYGLYKKFPTLVKNFKNLKSRVSGFKRIFFSFFFFVFVSWIDTLNANRIRL